MQEAKATIRHIRVSPKKLILLASAIKGKSLEQARWIVANSQKGYKDYFLHVITNTEAILKDKSVSLNNAYVKNATVDQGARLRRQRPGARGYSNLYRHAMSHLSLTVGIKEENKKDKDSKTTKDTKKSTAAKVTSATKPTETKDK